MNKLKKYNLDNERISRIFGYASVGAFNSSSARKRIKKAIETLIVIIEEEVKNKVQSVLND